MDLTLDGNVASCSHSEVSVNCTTKRCAPGCARIACHPVSFEKFVHLLQKIVICNSSWQPCRQIVKRFCSFWRNERNRWPDWKGNFKMADSRQLQLKTWWRDCSWRTLGMVVTEREREQDGANCLMRAVLKLCRSPVCVQCDVPCDSGNIYISYRISRTKRRTGP